MVRDRFVVADLTSGSCGDWRGKISLAPGDIETEVEFCAMASLSDFFYPWNP